MSILWWGNWIALTFGWLLFGFCVVVHMFGSKYVNDELDKVAHYYLAAYMILSLIFQSVSVILLRDLMHSSGV